MTPLKVLYWQDPPNLISDERGMVVTFSVDVYSCFRDRVLQELKTHLTRAQLMKTYADGKLMHVEFAVGDVVFLNLKAYRQTTVAANRNEKLSPHFFGPFEVLSRIGHVACLNCHQILHLVFHVSQLKKR